MLIALLQLDPANRGMFVRGMRTSMLAIMICGCGSRALAPAPAPVPAAAFRCENYWPAVEDAQRTPAAAGDSADVVVVNACGCSWTITTTAAEAAHVTAARDAWTRNHCGPTNCDEPCSPLALPSSPSKP